MEITNITLEGKPVENKGSSKSLKNICCPECNEPMKHYLIDHNLEKMYTVIACPKHPYVAWEDVFEKTDIPDVSQDWKNEDKRFN